MIWDDERALDQYAGEDWSIWTELSHVVDMWEGTFEDYWRLAPRPFADDEYKEEIEENKRQERISSIVVEVIAALSITGAAIPGANIVLTKESLKIIREAFRDLARLPLVRDRIGLMLARDITRQVATASDRAIRLLGVSLGGSLSDRASGYLSRVSRLFVQGLDVETAVMCRSTLEAALVDRLEEHFDGDAETPTLSALIRIAGQNRVLGGFQTARNRRGWRGQSGSGTWRAMRVKRAGDHIVHAFPRYPDEEGELTNAFETVRDLTLVVSELFPALQVTREGRGGMSG